MASACSCMNSMSLKPTCVCEYEVSSHDDQKTKHSVFAWYTGNITSQSSCPVQDNLAIKASASQVSGEIPDVVEPSLQQCLLAEAAARTGLSWAQNSAELHSLSALAKPADLRSVNAVQQITPHDPLSQKATIVHSTLSPRHCQLSRHSMHSMPNAAASEGVSGRKSGDTAQHLFWCRFYCNGGYCSPVQHFCCVQPAQVHLCQSLEERLLDCSDCRMRRLQFRHSLSAWPPLQAAESVCTDRAESWTRPLETVLCGHALSVSSTRKIPNGSYLKRCLLLLLVVCAAPADTTAAARQGNRGHTQVASRPKSTRLCTLPIYAWRLHHQEMQWHWISRQYCKHWREHPHGRDCQHKGA